MFQHQNASHTITMTVVCGFMCLWVWVYICVFLSDLSGGLSPSHSGTEWSSLLTETFLIVLDCQLDVEQQHHPEAE